MDDSVQNRVYYCCVMKSDDRILYKYSNGDQELENLAALCLERAPPFHTWYFQTNRKRTYGFFMEDGYIYFTIVDENLGNFGVVQFLKHVRDEFKKVAKKGGINHSNRVQEQLVPVICKLITSLEHVSVQSGNSFSPSPNSSTNGKIEVVVNSTKAPLLGKGKHSNKTEKKRVKDRHVISMRGIREPEEHRNSTNSSSLEANKHQDMVDSSSSSSQQNKNMVSTRNNNNHNNIELESQTIIFRKKWWRHVRIILAIDVVVCVVLFVIWLCICRGLQCMK